MHEALSGNPTTLAIETDCLFLAPLPASCLSSGRVLCAWVVQPSGAIFLPYVWLQKQISFLIVASNTKTILLTTQKAETAVAPCSLLQRA